VAAALSFATGSAGWISVGAVLFTISALLDRADGELARLTRRFSRLGHRLDLIADFGGDALIFIAMGIGARHGWLGWATPGLGITAAIGVGLMFWHLNRPGTERVRQPESRLIDPDDLMLAVPLLACWVGLAPVVLLAGTITPVLGAWLILQPLRTGRRVTEPAE
jgi:archaetidylinositol phosphate synthase